MNKRKDSLNKQNNKIDDNHESNKEKDHENEPITTDMDIDNIQAQNNAVK